MGAGAGGLGADVFSKYAGASDDSTRLRHGSLERLGNTMADGELILYRTDDGRSRVQLRAEGGTVWLSQADIAELFETTSQNITQHIRAIQAEGEVDPEATCKELLQVRLEGERNVRRAIKLYSLDVILSIGYRVRSIRGTQFRQWANTRLSEYLIKGFAIDEERLKSAEPFDYFDELLEKIREIRASEKRFYQKIKDVYTTSVNYDGKSDRAQKFFATVQNKMLHAVAGKTAAELIVSRADPEQPNMGLTSWKGGKVRKGDVTTAKNYLRDDEIRDLNRIVTMFLDVAEDRAERRKAMMMLDWEAELDKFLAYNDRPILDGAGRVSHGQMEQVAGERYVEFDIARKAEELRRAEEEYENELYETAKSVERLSVPRRYRED